MATKLDGLFTPGGRLVMGSLTVKDDKDYDGKPIADDKQRYFFGVAVPKNAPGVGELINGIWTMAATDYAAVPLVMNQINLGLAARDFAWKIADGDVVQYDKKTGQPRPIPDYIAGCYIFKFSTMFEIGACDVNGIDINRADIKVGDYVDVMFNAAVNGKMDDTAGIYLNPVAIRRLGFGTAISTTVNASAAFAGRSAAVPMGATTMPTAAGAVPPAMGNVAPVQTPPATAGGMVGMPGAAPQMPTASHGSAPHPMGGGMTGMGPTPHPTILQGPVGGMPGMGR